MALTYLDAVNQMLSALGEDQVGSLTAGGNVASNRCKIYANDAWIELTVDTNWSWLSTTVSLSSSGAANPDVFNVAGLQEVGNLLIKYDNLATYSFLPAPDENVLLVAPVLMTEETLWTSSTAGITVGTLRAYGPNVYTAASAGTTGTVPPTHTTGTVTDGGVNWTFSRLFTLSGVPFAFSTLGATQVRLRPYPGPVALQRYSISGTLAPTKLVNDNDVFPNLPIDFEPILVNMALSLAYDKHLDDPDNARKAQKRADDALGVRRARQRKSLGVPRLRMSNNGILL
jgi:hypothetical protein